MGSQYIDEELLRGLGELDRYLEEIQLECPHATVENYFLLFSMLKHKNAPFYVQRAAVHVVTERHRKIKEAAEAMMTNEEVEQLMVQDCARMCRESREWKALHPPTPEN